MILADTSVWIDHFRTGLADFAAMLEIGKVVIHPFVVGELACGHLRNRAEILTLLRSLPQAPAATFDEALHFIDSRKLMARGLGYVDVHLLAATALGDDLSLWTRDRRLHRIASELHLAFTPARMMCQDRL